MPTTRTPVILHYYDMEFLYFCGLFEVFSVTDAASRSCGQTKSRSVLGLRCIFRQIARKELEQPGRKVPFLPGRQRT
jgi:hypothetical protein